MICEKENTQEDAKAEMDNKQRAAALTWSCKLLSATNTLGREGALPVCLRACVSLCVCLCENSDRARLTMRAV